MKPRDIPFFKFIESSDSLLLLAYIYLTQQKAMRLNSEEKVDLLYQGNLSFLLGYTTGKAS